MVEKDISNSDTSDILEELHNKKDDIDFEPNEGQSYLLCSNNKSSDCPSLRYEYIEDQESVDRAFEILFETTLSSLMENHHVKNNSNLCQGVDSKTRGRTDD